jgi:hypothetical protein
MGDSEPPERIEFVRSGGFANISVRATVPASELRPEERAGVDALLGREAVSEAVAGEPDRFQYEVTVIAGSYRHRVQLGEREIDEPLRPLIECLERDAKPVLRQSDPES